tara:strand:+ start:241 stop:468 length:228 start_codon:yes stop_codon:yes gene_type:complete
MTIISGRISSSSFFTQIGNDIYGEAAGDEAGYSISLSADGSIVALGAPKNTHFVEYLLFETGVSLWETFVAKEKH